MSDEWAPGQMDDGSIAAMTEEEAKVAKIERDADEAAFEQLLDDGDSELRAAYEATGPVDEDEE
jgi:hypothetical protein